VATSAADRPHLDVDRLTASCLHPVIWLSQVGSTNAELAARSRSGAAEHTVVVAEAQTGGRGRLGRHWVSPRGAGLTFSVLWRPRRPIEDWTWLPLLAGVAVVSVVGKHAPDATLKWPNDVLQGGRKISGVLTELVDTGTAERAPAVVAGIGLNVSTTAAELPITAATSLALGGAQVDRTDLLIELLAKLCEEYASWSAGIGPSLRARYTDLCPTIRGESIRVELPTGEVVVGTGAGLAADGGLLVRTAGGIRALQAGDVVHARPGTG
jgi:BirA family transcriptional regulator, biotin operon repressor / biotin---[acetyl-CoA-carboxylase] ligase